MIVKPILIVVDSSIYTVLVPDDMPLSTQITAHSELVYDLSDETYIKFRGDKTLGNDTIKNLYSMSKSMCLEDFTFLMKKLYLMSILK